MELKDYLHLYLGAEISVIGSKLTYENNYSFMERLDSDNYSFGWDRVRLTLRRLSSMTEEEYREISQLLSINILSSVVSPNLKYSDKPRHVLVLENRVQTNTLLFTDGMVLLRAGYDLFHLIENGLAIESTK